MGKSKKGLWLVVILVVLLLSGAVAAYFAGALQPIIDMLSGEENATGAMIEEVTGDREEAVFYDLPEMLIRIDSSGANMPSFLKIGLSLELRHADDLERIMSLRPRIVDTFQIYLRDLRPDELSGQEEILGLREELRTRIDSDVAPVKIRDVLFKEFLVQ